MGILIKNNIVNQKGNPAWYESSLATRPIANLQGRMFVDTDTPSTGIYRDNGTTWDQVADPGAGSSGTLQQVTTNGSSTNVGITVSANGIGIGTAIPGANILDIHGTTGVLAQLENTGAQNSLLSFRNQGSGVWSIGNGYNAGANDFIVYDAVSFINRFTIKSTGQTFVGSDTTSSGLFVVNSATSDNHIVVLGANGPSVRLRNSGTSPTLNVGLGISTAANNFIQGSASGNFCIFNASTTASPILFGVYDSGSGNTIEGARLSAARNFLIGSTTDSGEKLQITGTSSFSSTIKLLTSYLSLQNTSYIRFSNTGGATRWGYIQHDGSNLAILNDISGGLIKLYGGNTSIDTGGFATDNGAKLQVNGNATFASRVNVNGAIDNSQLSLNVTGNGYFTTGINITGNGGALNAANILSIDQYIGASRLYTHGPDTTTKGSFEFHTNSSDGSVDVISLNIKSNGIINILNTPIYATNALALSGGLVFGDIYKNSVGVLSIVY